MTVVPEIVGLTDAERRLSAFGLSIAQILAIRDSARAAADDASPLMPINAPGMLAYIHGVDALRAQVLDGNWEIDRTLGIEAIISNKYGVRIGYQNVDRACDPDAAPMPRSSRGSASEKMCGPSLFEHFGVVLETDGDQAPQSFVNDPHSEQVATYFVMVGEDGNVELSSPIIKNGRYVGFRERILVGRAYEDWSSLIEPEEGPLDDFSVPVSLKD